MTANELRHKYLEFFKTKGHKIIPSASLIPENDPTVLFTTAGMHPLVPFLMGEKHPLGKRLVSCQKCIRTTDIDEVGDATHHTFFEMLGNWSLGDYFKKEAIEWSWEFLTSAQGLNLDKNRLAVSIFVGDEDAPFDREAFNLWRAIGLPIKSIAKLPKKSNWWGPAGLTGPCGPDTEMFYWSGSANMIPASFTDDPAVTEWVEIWNNVFMQYNKQADGSYKLLKQKNVDTGLGLERVVAILNGLTDNYQTDLFIHIINKIENLSNKSYNHSTEIKKSMRIIADHLKAATFIMGDNKTVTPSNTDQGYVVRRLIRRAIRYGRQLEIKEPVWTKEIAKIVAHDYALTYPELQKNINRVITQLQEEEIKFKKTLDQGLREFEKLTEQKLTPTGRINGKLAFNLYQTYGFPIEITKELAKEKGLTLDEEEFNAELFKHQELSRTASAGMFKGGLADTNEETKKLHTAAHLLLAALRLVLGEQVIQKGSNITAERLRFDFSYQEKMTEEQKLKVEKLVNNEIKKNLPVICEELTLKEAKARGAHGTFTEKYGEKVTVYTIGSAASQEPPFSREICGGPHVKNTNELGEFKIIKEESSSAGVRRIKAILQ